MTRNSAWIDLANRLTAALRPIASPIGIAFVSQGSANDVTPFEASYPAPNEFGRTGAVSVGCVFWMKAVDRMFSTNADDHANYSVGSYTHGFITMGEAATRDDVAAALESGWVNKAAVSAIPHLHKPARTGCLWTACQLRDGSRRRTRPHQCDRADDT